MIVIDSVTKRYGHARRAAAPALDAVSIELARGAVHAVVGPNGAGKSTLFSLVLGFIHPTAGEVAIETDEPRTWIRRHGAGYLPERFSLPPAWHVGEALRGFAARERLGRSTDAVAAARRALDRFGLAEHAHKRIGSLSRGLLQRLGLAQALLAPRALLVLDEPTEGLDPEWRLRLRTELDRLRADGRTVLLASHDLAEVERVADQVIVLEAGRVRQSFGARTPATALTYSLRLRGAAPQVAQLFPGAEFVGPETQGAPAATPKPGGSAADAQLGADIAGAVRDAEYRVVVADVGELNARLAALLGTGAQLVALEPAAEPLEARVRRVLGEDGA